MQISRDHSIPGAIRGTAFCNTDAALGQRIVDWVSYTNGPFETLEADEIDAVVLSGEGMVIASLNSVAVLIPPWPVSSAAIGTVTAVCFAARNHPIPPAPAPVTATALPDPVLSAVNSSSTPLPSRTTTEVGGWNKFCGSARSSTCALDYGPRRSYVISRGPSQTQQNDVRVPKDQPLVLSTPGTIASAPAVTLLARSLELYGQV